MTIHAPPAVSTPRLAPWEHVQELCNKLDRLIALLEAWVPTAAVIPTPPELVPITTKLDEILKVLKTLGIVATTPWVAKEPETIYDAAIRATGTFYADKMVDWRKGKRMAIKLASSLNQAVKYQLIGNIDNNRVGSSDIASLLVCAANGKELISPSWSDWYPYIGVKIVVTTAPTAGRLKIVDVIQE